MDRHLNLIKTDQETIEKRVFPRFPFTFLTFKTSDERLESAFEVVDISQTGAQLCRRDGGHDLISDDEISGEFHWYGQQLSVRARVKWTSGQRLGLKFLDSTGINEFLSLDQMKYRLRPVHDLDSGLETPMNLKFWIRADGPVEIFVWAHRQNEWARFQVIVFHDFVEWVDGIGLASGRLITKRDLDTPLLNEDEFVFKMDQELDAAKIQASSHLIENTSDTLLPSAVKEFLLRKLGHSV